MSKKKTKQKSNQTPNKKQPSNNNIKEKESKEKQNKVVTNQPSKKKNTNQKQKNNQPQVKKNESPNQLPKKTPIEVENKPIKQEVKQVDLAEIKTPDLETKKENKITKPLSLLIIVCVLTLLVVLIFYNKKTIQFHEIGMNLIKKEYIIKNKIAEHYNKYVITTAAATLYIKTNNTYKAIGRIAKNQELTLKDTNVDYDSIYFHIEGKEDYYIEYSNVKKINEIKQKDRYKN